MDAQFAHLHLSALTLCLLGCLFPKFDLFTDLSQPIACAIFYAILKANRFYRTGSITWLTDLSHNPRRFQEIINHYEALLYLRDDDAQRGGVAEVMTEHDEQPTMMMDGLARELVRPDAMQQRTAGSVVGAGGELNAAAMEPQNHPARRYIDAHTQSSLRALASSSVSV